MRRSPRQAIGPRKANPSIRLHRPEAEESEHRATWLINGFPAEIKVWTPEEWEREPNPPAQAQLYPSGVRVLLMMA